MKDRYVVLTAVSSFRQRYVVPVSEVQKWNEETKLTDTLAQQWAQESVEAEEINEFSQKWIGEEVYDINIVEEEEVLALWQKDNPNMTETDMPMSRRLSTIRNWKADKR
jgi:hypothetical protein